MAEKAEIVVSGRDATATMFQSIQQRIGLLRAGVAGFAGGAAFGALTTGVEYLQKAFDRIDPRSVFDAADALSKLSQRTGISVENLSALEYAGKLADVSTEELAGSLKKLNVNIAAAARGEEEQAGAFRALGIAVKDSSGNVRSAGDVLGDVADKFSGYADGANKVAIANAIGGKSFEKLIPLLNGGRAGLQSAREELEKFGGVIDSGFAVKSEQFNDNLTKLAVSANRLKIEIAGGLIDALVNYSDKAVEAAKSGHLLRFSIEQALSAIGSGPGLVKGWIFGSALPADKMKEAQVELDALNARVAALQAQLALDPGNAGLVKQLALVSAYAKSAAADVDKARGDAVGGGRGFINPPLVVPSPPPTKPQAPALPKTSGSGAADAEALLRKQLEGRIKAIEAALENERDLFQFNESKLAELYQHGDVAIEQFYDAKAAAATEFLAKQTKAFDAELAALRDFQAKAVKPQEKEDAKNRIADVLAKQSKAYREAGQAAEVAETQRSRAAEEFRKSLLDLDAQLAELSGDKFGAELNRNAIRLEEAQKLLGKVGGDPARVQQLRQLLDAQAQFNKLQVDAGLITDRARVAEEAFMISADRGGKSQLETEAGIRTLRAASLAQLDALIEKTRVLAETSTDPQVILYYEQLKLARERAFDAQDPAMLRFQETIDKVGQSLSSSLEDAIVNGGKLSDVFKAAEKDLVRLITHDFFTAPLATSMSNWLKDMTGVGGQKSGGLWSGGGGGGAFGSWLGSLFGGGSVNAVGGSAGAGFGTGAAYGNMDLGLFLHGGGVVGDGGGSLRPVAPAVFDHAERYHRGGLVAGEVPAILRKREEVITRDDPRHRDNGGLMGGRRMASQTNNFMLQGPVSRDTQTQIAAKAWTALRQQANRG